MFSEEFLLLMCKNIYICMCIYMTEIYAKCRNYDKNQFIYLHCRKN